MLNNLEEMFYPCPEKVFYNYGEYQKEFDQLHPNIDLIEGFPSDVGELVKGYENSLIVLDDLMSQCSHDPCVVDLFTQVLTTVVRGTEKTTTLGKQGFVCL
jgi:hypothetical protein